MSNLNSRDVIRTLQRAGFTVTRHRDHIRLRRGANFVSVPHACDLHMKTFRLILKQSGMTVDEFEQWRKG